MNKKALGLFLGLTFGLTVALTLAVRLSGFTLFDAPVLMTQLAVAVAMFIPALGAVIVQKAVLKKPLRDLGFRRFGSAREYLKAYGTIVIIFAANYAIAWAFFVKPDFTMIEFMKLYGISGGLPVAAPVMLAAFAALTFVGAPIFNMIPSLGEEIGWRGFLLPALEPMGKARAALRSGMIWALWHTPMIVIIGFAYGREAWPGVLLHFAAVTGLGVWMGRTWFRTRSTTLASFTHAVFNANAYGIWTMVFVGKSRLLVGAVGVIGAALCLVLGIASWIMLRREDRQDRPAPEQAPIK